MTDAPTSWRRCSSCKQDIPFSQLYWVCNVSTCNRKRTGMIFCTVSCWETHVPVMRHRESWAEERHSPNAEVWRKEQAAESSSESSSTRPAKRTLVRPAPKRPHSSEKSAVKDDLPNDILIVASKLKAYIKAASGMNTSDPVMARLSDHLRALCHEAIREARKDERRTVMDRDFPDP
jgi:hypothetical protein